MTTTTLTSAPQAPATANVDLSSIEGDIDNASRILRTAAQSLAEAYALPDGTVLSYEDALHRYALANRLADNIAVANSLVSSTAGVTAEVILANHQHGDNIDIEGNTFHRYDETRANSVEWKAIAAKAKSYLSGSQLGVITKMEATMKSATRTYFRLKPGVYKGK